MRRPWPRHIRTRLQDPVRDRRFAGRSRFCDSALIGSEVNVIPDKLKCMVRFLRDVHWRRLASDEAVTAVEYAVLLAVLILGAVGGISALGRKNSKIWAAVGDALGAVL